MKSGAGLRGSGRKPKARTKVEAPAAETAVSSSSTTLIGCDQGVETVRDSVRQRKGLHIYGPAGVGKSALLDRLRLHWDDIGDSSQLIFCRTSATLREILVCLAEALFTRTGPLAGTNRYLEPIEVRTTPDIRAHSNRDIRNMIFPRIGQGDFCVILDHLDHITPGINAVLSALHERTCLITASRQSWVIGDHSFAGKIAYCLYLFPKLRLENLKRKEATDFMQRRYKSMGLKLLDKARLFNDIFLITQGNPKMMHDILEKAGKAEYIVDGKLNLNLIVIDCRIDALNAL